MSGASVFNRGHEYFEHDADFGVRGWGATPEEAFIEAARATFALMIEPTDVRLVGEVEVSFEEEDLEIALVRWLNSLLGAARVDGLALADFDLHRTDRRWFGHGRGDSLASHEERGTEVKGATMTMLAVGPRDGGWEARCVVDV